MHYKLLAEYRSVLSRPAQLRETGLTVAQLDRFLAALTGVADEVEVRYLWRPNLRDEDYNFIYELAFAAGPCMIVTHNVRDFEGGEHDWPGVETGTPQQVLKGLPHA